MAQGRFGPNEWLVDEIYQQYLTDRESVDPAWWDFFADYSPADGSAMKTAIEHTGKSAKGTAPATPDTAAANGSAAPPVP
ncbi:MAG: 2-oxoglutarate dehydrogenase E1 subunit family protein, partial [Candidatus Nanopelagicales bacterium]